MTRTQKKVLAVLMTVLGTIGVISFGMNIADIYEVKSQLNKMDGMGAIMKGMMSSMGAEISYLKSTVLLLLSLFIGVVGFLILGFVTRENPV